MKSKRRSPREENGSGKENGAGGSRTEALPSTMRAVVQDKFGQADEVLTIEQQGLPSIGEKEVLIKVHAAGVDRGVWHLVAGLPYMVRLAGYGIRKPKLRVPGFDFAGRVERVGGEVTSVRPGDEVFGIAKGSFAQYAAAVEDKVVAMPESLTPEQAAAVPISGLTALQAVRDQAGVEPGESVLVIGASGGVGSFATQIAKAFGADVTGVCSTGKVEMVRELGADRVIDYTREGVTDSGERYDVILDIAGNRRLSELRRALKPRGRLVIVGGENEGKLLGGTDRQLRAMLLSPLVSQKLGAFVSSENGADIKTLSELLDSGRLRPAIDRTFELEQAAEAIQFLIDGRTAGKVVLDVR